MQRIYLVVYCQNTSEKIIIDNIKINAYIVILWYCCKKGRERGVLWKKVIYVFLNYMKTCR